jgi:hypothetical protein
LGTTAAKKTPPPHQHTNRAGPTRTHAGSRQDAQGARSRSRTQGTGGGRAGDGLRKRSTGDVWPTSASVRESNKQKKNQGGTPTHLRTPLSRARRIVSSSSGIQGTRGLVARGYLRAAAAAAAAAALSLALPPAAFAPCRVARKFLKGGEKKKKTRGGRGWRTKSHSTPCTAFVPTGPPASTYKGPLGRKKVGCVGGGRGGRIHHQRRWWLSPSARCGFAPASQNSTDPPHTTANGDLCLPRTRRVPLPAHLPPPNPHFHMHARQEVAGPWGWTCGQA